MVVLKICWFFECREARSLLSERVKHEEAAAFAAQAGGFHPEAPHFARHV